MMAVAYPRVKASIRTAYSNYTVVRWVSKLLPIGIFFLLWELASGTLVPVAVLPPVTAIAGEAARLATTAELQSNLGVTLFRGATAIVLATILAVPLGVWMARNERVRRNVDPVIAITYPVPKAPLIPLMVFWLGMGNLSRIILGVIGAVLPIILSSYNAASNVNQKLLWAAQSMGVSRAEEIYKVVVPASLPQIMTGVRIGLIFSFIIVVASEMIMANSGLGFMVAEFGVYGQYERLFAVVFWITALVAGIDRCYLLLTNYLLRWSDQEVGGV